MSKEYPEQLSHERVICPYCLHEHGGDDRITTEGTVNDFECQECEKEFIVNTSWTWTWLSEPKEQDEDEDAL